MQMTQNEPLLILNETLAKEIAYGVHSTLSNMFGIKPEMGEYRIEKNTSIKADVSGIIVVMRDVADGTLVVSFPKETIFAMLSKMYRKPFTEIDNSVRMGVGELTNIIYGVMKSNLNKSGYSFK